MATITGSEWQVIVVLANAALIDGIAADSEGSKSSNMTCPQCPQIKSSLLVPDIRIGGRPCNLHEEVRFAADSPLEQRGFELSLPPHAARSRAPAPSVVRLKRRFVIGTGSSRPVSSSSEFERTPHP